MKNKGRQTEKTNNQELDKSRVLPKETEYKFNDRIKIISGFYKGHLGKVIDRKHIVTTDDNGVTGTVFLYNIVLDCIDSVTVFENEVEKI